MQNVHELFSNGRDLPVELVPIVVQICSVIEGLRVEVNESELHKLWEKLEKLLGVESVYNESEQWYEACLIYEGGNNAFDSLCKYLPAYFGVHTEYVVLPNGFVLYLDPAKLHYGLNIDDVASQIRSEIKYAEEMTKFWDYIQNSFDCED